ncbi:MAG: hypothetical protein J0L73_13500 [Verrucomicrobia bacterium]|nr:hypothetical protein [Verrucomicrobiota bacterium]
MNSALSQDIQVWLMGLSIVAGLFLISLIRIYRLSRSNHRLRLENAKMTKQTVLQQMEVTSIHHDAMSWRAKTQRQFDALRSEFSHRLQQADQGGLHALKGLDEAHKKSLSEALAKISELEAALGAKPAAPVASALPKPPPPPVPALPAVDTLRIQTLESELAAAKAEIATSRQQTATLHRALLLTRRRLPVTAMRKSAPRTTARNA